MSSIFRRFFGTSSNFVVNFDEQPLLPRGAKKILRHVPSGSGVTQITPRSLELVEFVRGTTYNRYYEENKDKPLADVTILDSIINEITTSKEMNVVLKKYFGSFSGQIFFLGTSFESEDGRECVAYLNINTYQPALRYMCPSAHIINHDVACCACYYKQ